MSVGIQVDKALTSVPLFLTIEREGVGGVTGQSPTVALRDATTLNRYLDFADDTFKTSGWTTKYAALDEIERGHYQKAIDPSALPIEPLDVLVAEYHVDDGSDVVGDASDLLIVVQIQESVWFARKAITNRMEEFAGSPGQLILWDDDGVTPLMSWQLRDGTGGAVQLAVGAPAKRSAGV